MARVVAEKLAGISRARQVLCVTHAAQIAAMGDNHFLIRKQTDGVTTSTDVQALSAAQRREELARLVGGAASALSRDHAAQLLEWCANYKQTL
jgi:DNA repair protein RecN (Recombination protein N)